LAQQPQPQDHRIDVAFQAPASFQMEVGVIDRVAGQGHGC
jgi:hypothetical protein